MQRRYELSDDEWHLIQDLFPPPKKMGRPRRDDRTLFNGVFWILCSGSAWCDLPERYGPWQTAFDRFCKWKQDGTFDRIVEKQHLKLDEDGLLDYATWMMDATHIRATQAAAGAKKKGKEGEEEPPDHALGRSRGGLTTKIHLLCDAVGHPLAVDLLPGNQSESTQAERLLSKVRIPTKQGRPRNRPQYLVADKSYDVSRIRGYLRKRGIKVAIPNKAIPKGRKRRKRGPRPKCDKRLYAKRNIVEGLFGLLKHCRRIVTRFEKKATHFLTMVKLACIRQLFKAYFSDTTLGLHQNSSSQLSIVFNTEGVFYEI